MFSVWQRPRVVWGGGDEGGSGGGGSDKTYNSLSEAARDGQHGKAVNIKGKGRQKVEFADKSYNQRMATVSANAGGGGGTVAKAAKTVSTAGGRGPDGRYEPIPGPRTIAQRIKGSFDGTDSLHRPASNFKTINNSQRRALEAAGYSVTKQGTVKSRDGSATVAGSRWSRSNVVNRIMAENADDRASVRSGGGGGKPAPVIPKKIVRPKLRPADLQKPTTAPLDYDTLYTGDPGMFMSPYQVGPRPSTYSPSSFPGGGDPMLADPSRGAPSMGTSFGSFGNPVDMSRDVPQRRAPLVADPYLSDVLADERLGTYDDLKDSQRMAAEQQLQRDSLTPVGGRDTQGNLLSGNPYRDMFPGTIIGSPSNQDRYFYEGDGDRGSMSMEAGDFDPVDLSTSGRSYSDILREQQVLRESGGSNRFLDEASFKSAGLGNFFENLFSSDEGVASLPVRVGRQDGPGTIANAVPGAVTEADAKAYAQGFGAIDPDTGLRPRINKTSNIVPGETDLLKKNVATMARLGSGALDFAAQPFGQGAQDFSQSMMDKAKAFDENITSRLPQDTQDKLNAELSWDNVGTQVAANAGPVAASVGAATFGLVPAIAAGVTLGIGGLVNQVNDTIDAEFKSGNLQNTEAFKALVEGGLDPETAKQTMASQLANQAAPYVAAVAGAGGVVTNKVLNIAGAPKLLNNFIGKKIATPLGQRAARATTAGVLEAGAEGFGEYAEGKLPGMVTGYDPLRTTAAQDRQNFFLGATLGGLTATGLTAAGQQGPTVQRAADIETVGTDPMLTYNQNLQRNENLPDPFASPNQLADQLAAKAAQQQQATPKPTSDAAASVISGAPKGDPNVLANQLARERAEAELKAKTQGAPSVPVQLAPMDIAPNILQIAAPNTVVDPVGQANLQNQRGFDPSQKAAQAAAITPDDIGTDMLDDGASADAAARERLASELLQSGTIPNPNALADQLAAKAARDAATADGLETAPVEAAVQGTLPGLDIDDGSNPQSIGAARVDDTTRLADENAQLADIFKRAETEAAALDDGLALDTLDLSGKMFTGGVPTNFETTGLSRFSPLADQIYTTSQRADMQRANQLDMALRARRLAEEAAQAPQNRAQAALDALEQGGPDKSAVEQVNDAREATKQYQEYVENKNRIEALNRAMRSGIGSVFNADGSVQPTTPLPAAEITAPEAVSTSGIVPPVDAAAVADQIVGSSEAGLDAGLSEDAAMAEIMRNFDTNIPLTETVQERVARQLESQRRRQEGQIPARNFDTNIPRPGTDTPAQQIARQLENQRRRQEGQIPDRNFLTDLPRPGTDTPAQQIARQLENQRRRQQSQLGGIGSLATVPPEVAPLEGEVLDDLGPFVGGRGEVPPTSETIEGVAFDLNQVPSPMGRADMDPFLYEGEVIDPVKDTKTVDPTAGQTVEGTINRPTPTVEDLAQGIGSLTAAEDAAMARITPPTADVESKIEQDRKKARNAALRSLSGQTIDTESVMPPAGGTPYFPELPTDDVLPPEEREGGPSGPSDDRPAVVPVDMTDDNNDAQGCPPGYRRVLDPATGRYICLKIEEGSAGVPSDPAEEAEEDDVVIDIPVTERPKISPYYVPEMVESNYTPYVPGRRASTQ